MKLSLLLLPSVIFTTAPVLPAQDAGAGAGEGAAVLHGALRDVLGFLNPDPGTAARSIKLDLMVESATGGAGFLKGRAVKLVLQPPDRFSIQTDIDGPVSLSTDSRKMWIHVPKKNMLIEGDESVPRFSARPDSVQKVTIPKLPLPSIQQLALVPMMADIKLAPGAAGGMTLAISPKEEAAKALNIPRATLTIGVPSGAWPDTFTYDDHQGATAVIRLRSHEISGPLPDSDWAPQAEPDDKKEKVALAHLTRFLETAAGSLGSKIPTLPPAVGKVSVLAVEGKGRLEDHDGTRVVILQGTPTEMGRQQGILLKPEIRRVVNRILYGVGVGSSFDKGRWFFGEIEEAVSRTSKHIDPRYLEEMDSLADAAGLDREEVRLSNFFPELFHCSGFALMGKATEGGMVYHGRVLDYLRGVGLEENAVVMINKPDWGHAWANVGYAGFTGSVTAMNEKRIAMGEMGGRGEGAWDGKPMAQLIREVMEKADTLEEAIEIMKSSPRTCEYYYVISDANTKKACGIKATPEKLEVIWPGEKHPQLDTPVEDAVLLSAGDRYRELTRRVLDGYGKFNADRARELMTRPVCMGSNIHSVLFAPDTLDFWVANADSKNVASETRYTKYNLGELIKPAKP